MEEPPNRDKKNSEFPFSKVECVSFYAYEMTSVSITFITSKYLHFLSLSSAVHLFSLQAILCTQSLLYISPSVLLNYFAPVFSSDNRLSKRNN